MNLEAYLRLAAEDPTFSIDTTWAQGRTSFGGLSAALALNKILTDTGTDRSLRSLSVNFCGPSFADAPLSLTSQILSEGKSTLQATGTLLHEGRPATHVTACFGADRDSSVSVEADRTELPAPGTGKQFGYVKGFTPEFVQHVTFDYHKGGMPFTNSEHNELAGWVKQNEPGEQFSAVHLVALTDSWPPTVLQKLKGFAPCATVSWNMEFIHPVSGSDSAITLSPDSWIWYDARIRHAGNGYAHTEAELRSPDGTLLALSRQLIAIYG